MTDEEIDKYMGVKRKLYTLADLEQARKQGAEDERARCVDAVVDSTHGGALRSAVDAIRALGPIGETREETERRVVDATIKYLLDHGYCDDDVWAELDKDELIKAMRGK